MAARRYEIYQYEKINFVSLSDHTIFFLLYKIFTIHNDVCGDFSNIFQNLSEGPTNLSKDSPEDIPKISEDNRRLSKTTEDVSIIHQQI